MSLSQKDFVSIGDYNKSELEAIIDLAIEQKAQLAAGRLPRSHVGRSLACIFHKPSLRTRVSFEVAMNDLGGTSLYLTDKELGIGSREAPEDVARVLNGEGVVPIKVVLDREQTVTWCACGTSGKVPFCDGSHARL